MRLVILVFSFLLPLMADSFQAFSSQDSIIVESLISEAKSLDLANSKEWKDLLHIDKNSSEIVSPYFFLTPLPASKNLSSEELEATLRAFYQPIDTVVIPEVIRERRQKQIQEFQENNINLPARSIEIEDYHALCRFPARFAFLSKHLHFESLPKVRCIEFETMRDYVAPTKASIAFPSAHINSPASMFGHTFLILDSKFQSRLLAFAINYQADADENTENAIAFTFKGLFGFYTGSYSILPYYDKIKEYSNTESRDIWEYELNLTPEEITRLYNHIWELSDAFSYYYFFNHNCSYNVLWLLEVARPSLNLRHQFIYQVNPPETLFAMQKAHLISNSTYRPSKRTKLLAYEKVMSTSQVSLVKALSNGAKQPQEIIKDSSLTLQEKQYVLESALELSEYYLIKRQISQEEYLQIAYDLASARSELGASPQVPLSIPSNPLEGNQSLRITPLLLANEKSVNPALDFRISFHDITDNDKGYLKGAQIEFMRTLGFYDTKNKGLKLNELNILSVASIAPMGKFFKPISYRIETGFNRLFNDDDLHYFMAFGGGASYDFGGIAYAYYLLEPTFFLDASSRADFSLNQVFGIVAQDNNRLKATLEYKFKSYTPTHFGHSLDSTLSVNLKQNLALIVREQVLKQENSSKMQSTTMVGARFYF